jgi:hypothetical protein
MRDSVRNIENNRNCRHSSNCLNLQSFVSETGWLLHFNMHVLLMWFVVFSFTDIWTSLQFLSKYCDVAVHSYYENKEYTGEPSVVNPSCQKMAWESLGDWVRTDHISGHGIRKKNIVAVHYRSSCISNFFLGATAPIWALAYLHETLRFTSVF